MSEPPDLQYARDHWRWRGQDRPAFAVVPNSAQESVWDYPRPPRLSRDTREVVVRWGTVQIARTQRAIRVLETAHPPSFYLPWQDVNRSLFREAPGASLCEWKGPARYWSLLDADRVLPAVAWSYPRPFAGAEELADCVAFYPSRLECRVGDMLVTAQPGGFYGGWITPDLVGPFKGEPGSSGW
jgi:uncharacterized protein (DUF427 family)